MFMGFKDSKNELDDRFEKCRDIFNEMVNCSVKAMNNNQLTANSISKVSFI
jgi:hypothetical protein